MVEKTGELKVFGMKPESGRWLFVVFGLIAHLCYGAVYAYSVFKKPVMNLWGLDAVQGIIPFILFLAFFAFLMPVGGRLIQKHGPRKIGIIGGILVGIGWILAGFSPNLIALCISYGVIGGIGVGLAYGAPIQTSTRWFPDKKGLAVGLTVGGFGLSAAIVSVVGNALVRSSGVLRTFTILGIVFLILTIAMALTLKFPPAGWKPASSSKGPAKAATYCMDCNTSTMVHNKLFVALFACFTIGCTAGLMAIGMAGVVGAEVIGVSAGVAATFVAVFSIFNFAGRPIFGALTDKITPSNAAVLSFIFIIIGTALMRFASGPGTVAIYAISFILLYLALGGWLAIAPTATATFFGPTNNASNFGVVFVAFGVGAIIGNLVSGFAKVLFGSYDMAFLIAMIVAVIGLIIAATMLKMPKTQAKAAAPAKK